VAIPLYTWKKYVKNNMRLFSPSDKSDSIDKLPSGKSGERCAEYREFGDHSGQSGKIFGKSGKYDIFGKVFW
jgi:hypothetical protein